MFCLTPPLKNKKRSKSKFGVRSKDGSTHNNNINKRRSPIKLTSIMILPVYLCYNHLFYVPIYNIRCYFLRLLCRVFVCARARACVLLASQCLFCFSFAKFKFSRLRAFDAVISVKSVYVKNSDKSTEKLIKNNDCVVEISETSEF